MPKYFEGENFAKCKEEKFHGYEYQTPFQSFCQEGLILLSTSCS